MSKINIFLLSFLLNFVFFSCSLAYDKKIENDLYEINLKTQIKMDEIFKNYKGLISIKNVKLSVWTGKDGGSLQNYDFLSEDNKNDIRMKFTAYIDVKISSGLFGKIRMARFSNQQDAIRAYRDSAPYSTGIDVNSLFSGKTIDGTYLCSQNLNNETICSHIMHKGITFRITLWRKCSEGYKTSLKKEDFDFADNMILTIKDLIDKSIK